MNIVQNAFWVRVGERWKKQAPKNKSVNKFKGSTFVVRTESRA
jgi:hypothetical protein